MDEYTTNDTNGVTDAHVSPVVPVAPQPVPVKKTKLIPILVILNVLLLVTGGVVATLFFTGAIGNKNTPKDGEEVAIEIEDQDLLTNLNQKLRILFGAPGEGDEIVLSTGYYDDIALIVNRDLTEEQKTWQIFNSLGSDDSILPSEAQLTSMQSTWFSVTGTAAYGSNSLVAFNASTFSEKYKEVFGTQPINQLNTASDRVIYDSEYDLYFTFKEETSASSLVRHYFINEYVSSGDVIYVYLVGALHDTSTGEVYCYVFMPEELEKPSVCATVEEGKTFTLDKTNAGNFNLVRLDFMQVDDKLFFIGANSVLNPETKADGEDEEVIEVIPDEQ